MNGDSSTRIPHNTAPTARTAGGYWKGTSGSGNTATDLDPRVRVAESVPSDAWAVSASILVADVDTSAKIPFARAAAVQPRVSPRCSSPRSAGWEDTVTPTSPKEHLRASSADSELQHSALSPMPAETQRLRVNPSKISMSDLDGVLTPDTPSSVQGGSSARHHSTDAEPVISPSKTNQKQRKNGKRRKKPSKRVGGGTNDIGVNSESKTASRAAGTHSSVSGKAGRPGKTAVYDPLTPASPSSERERHDGPGRNRPARPPVGAGHGGLRGPAAATTHSKGASAGPTNAWSQGAPLIGGATQAVPNNRPMPVDAEIVDANKPMAIALGLDSLQQDDGSPSQSPSPRFSQVTASPQRPQSDDFRQRTPSVGSSDSGFSTSTKHYSSVMVRQLIRESNKQKISQQRYAKGLRASSSLPNGLNLSAEKPKTETGRIVEQLLSRHLVDKSTQMRSSSDGVATSVPVGVSISGVDSSKFHPHETARATYLLLHHVFGLRAPPAGSPHVLTPAEVRRKLDELTHLSGEVALLFLDRSLGPQDRVCRRDLVHRLRHLLCGALPSGYQIQLHGSSAAGFATTDSDLDLDIVWPHKGTPALPPTATKPESRDNSPRVDTMHPTNANARALLGHIAPVLTEAGFLDVQCLLHARVPIVKLTDATTGLSCDVAHLNKKEDHNSRLLREYAECDPRVVPLVVAIKHWAKCRGIAVAFQGTLSSFAYTLLVLQYLQMNSNGIIPNLQSQKEKDDYRTRKACIETYFGRSSAPIAVAHYAPAAPVRHWSTTGQKPADYYSESSEEEDEESEVKEPSDEEKRAWRLGVGRQLGSMLVDFFDFYSNPERFKADSMAVSVRHGKLLERTDERVAECLGSVTNRTCLVIEDPFDKKNNVAANVRPGPFSTIVQEFTRAREMLTRGRSFAEVCAPDDDVSRALRSRRPRRGGHPARLRPFSSASSSPVDSRKTPSRHSRPGSFDFSAGPGAYDYLNPELKQY